MKRDLVFIFFIFLSLHTIAQNQHVIDSLMLIMKESPEDSVKVKNLLYLGKEYEDKVPIKANVYYQQALAISNLMNDPIYKASCCEYLGTLYQYSLAKYDSAKMYFTQCVNIRKKVLGENNLEYAVALNNLASLCWSMGNYEETEPLLLEAKRIKEQILGRKHASYATSLANLAVFYEAKGNYLEAEPLFIEAKNLRREIFGDKHPDYARSLNNLGSLYDFIGNYPEAEKFYVEAMNIRKNALGEKHPLYANSLNNLAYLYSALGNNNLAEKMFLEVLKIRKESQGVKHPLYATVLNNLATLYQEEGNAAKSESERLLRFNNADTLFQETLKIRKEVLGTKHPEYALSLNNLSSLYKDMGRYSEALTLVVKATEIDKEILGNKHPDYVKDIRNQAMLYKTLNEDELAEPLFLEYINSINESVSKNFAFLSEKEKELYFLTQAGKISDFYSFSLKRKRVNNDITKIVFNNVIRNKGLLLKSSTAMRFAVLNSNDSILISKYDKWIALKKEISYLFSEEISKRQKKPEELEEMANMIEKELVKESQIFKSYNNMQNLTWESVRNSLKPSEASIEFISFPLRQKSDSILYCAMIVTSESKYPEMIQLFYEEQIMDILKSFSGDDLKRINGIYGTNEKRNDRLYKLLWEPLEKYLGGIQKIYYSPDGILHKISFSALSSDKDIFLCDKYNLERQSSTGIVSGEEKINLGAVNTAGIYGGIEYSSDTTSNKIWNYLPGTKSEGDNIEHLFAANKINTSYFSGKDAGEKEFKEKSSSCDLLHIATHGFFYPDPEKEQNESNLNLKVETGNVNFRGDNRGFGVWQFVKNKNPLMRSGLVFAGANNVWGQRFIGAGEDGVLTAQEVSQLNLQKTQLVVLSACETGLGDIKGSEGVYGLQRAFKMAGVKYIIMSLWQVPDKETSEFMVTFYNKLLKIKNVRKSFNETQKEMRLKYDPYFWAAFVLVE